MKKVKPIKKENKTLKLFFFSLFKNDAAIEGGRRQPWWMAVILFVASILIATIPTMISQGTSRGDAVFNNPQYQTDIGLVKFGEALNAEGVNLVYELDSNEQYVLNNTGEPFETKFTNKITLTALDNSSVDFHYFSFEQDRVKLVLNETTKTYDEVVESFEYLRVYYTGNIDKVFANGTKTFTASLKLESYLFGLTEDAVALSVDPNVKVTSYVILGKDDISVRIYNPTKVLKGSDSVRNIGGLTSGLKQATNINEFVTKTASGDAILAQDHNYVTKVQANWKSLINVTHEPVKVALFWTNSGFILLTNFIITLFIGLIFFITTRGKFNPNRDIKFFESIKIGAWLALSPALITLILGPFLGSILGSNTIMIYIMTLGMRSVWVSMKTVQPPVTK